MAKVWFFFEGPTPTMGPPSYELPAEDCADKLGLSHVDFLSDPGHPPKFDDPKGLGQFAGYKHVVVELGQEDVASVDLRPGFYRLRMSPRDVVDRLGRPPRAPWEGE